MKINYSFFLIIIFSLYTGYFDKLLLMCSCLFIHELGHILFIKIFNIKIKGFTLSLYGGVLNIDFLDYININKIKKIIIYSAGITLNLILYLLFNNNFFGQFNKWLFIINILPIYPLDGFNILKIFFNKTLLNNITIVSLVIILIFAIYNQSIGLLVIISILIIKNINYFRQKDKIYLYNLINNMV